MFGGKKCSVFPSVGAVLGSTTCLVLSVLSPLPTLSIAGCLTTESTGPPEVNLKHTNYPTNLVSSRGASHQETGQDTPHPALDAFVLGALMTLHHSSSTPTNLLCRLSRSPLLVFGIVLLYFVYVVKFQDEGNVSLRASSKTEAEEESAGSLEVRLSEDAQWEEDPGWTLVGQGDDVKGGVELYPLQVCWGVLV